jgi:hypothetical protein
MPARRPHVTPGGDLETSCTDVLLYRQLNGSSSESKYVSDQASTVGVTGFEPATSSSRTPRSSRS